MKAGTVRWLLAAGAVNVCLAGQAKTEDCAGSTSMADMRSRLSVPDARAVQGPIALALGKNEKAYVSVHQRDEASGPLIVRVARQLTSGCWMVHVPLTIDGRSAFGIRSTALQLASVFAEDVTGDGKRELVVLYSALIEGTGDPERYAAAIFRIEESLSRLTDVEGKYMNLRTAKQFREVVRSKPRNRPEHRSP